MPLTREFHRRKFFRYVCRAIIWHSRNKSATSAFESIGAETSVVKAQQAMPEPAEDNIVRHLIEALERLHEDLDRVELWTSALGYFQRPVPDYEPGERHLLPTAQPERPSASS
jgi:hypothetical protein